jgi:carbamoylphosphate synthase large subunit
MCGKVLLVTTVSWPSAARYASGFVASGVEVDAFAPARSPSMVSRYPTRRFIYEPLAPIASLKRAIAASKPDLLVACDDRAVIQMLALFESEMSRSGETAVAALIRRSLGTPERYRSLLSRNETLRDLKSRGVRVAETLPVDRVEDLLEILKRVGLPAVLKSDGSWGGDGVVIVRSYDEAVAAFSRLSRAPSRLRSLVRAVRRRDLHHLAAALAPKGHAVCIQRFIEGKPAASAFAAWQGKIAGSIYYDVLEADGEIGPPNVIRRVDCEQIDFATRTVAECFGLSGLHGIDFIRDAKGDVHLIEVNPRATQGGTLPFGVGRDLPASLAASAWNDVAGQRKAIRNDVVVFFPREWKRDPSSKYLREGHHEVPWDDPSVLKAMLG